MKKARSQHSAFSKGITDTKLGIIENPFSGKFQKTQWEEGVEAASDPKYIKKGVLLKDKPIYEMIDGDDRTEEDKKEEAYQKYKEEEAKKDKKKDNDDDDTSGELALV